MATGIVLSLGTSTTATYTSKTNAKLFVQLGGTGAGMGNVGVAGNATTQTMYIGSGQSITFSSGSANGLLVTQYEE